MADAAAAAAPVHIPTTWGSGLSHRRLPGTLEEGGTRSMVEVFEVHSYKDRSHREYMLHVPIDDCTDGELLVMLRAMEKAKPGRDPMLAAIKTQVTKRVKPNVQPADGHTPPGHNAAPQPAVQPAAAASAQGVGPGGAGGIGVAAGGAAGILPRGFAQMSAADMAAHADFVREMTAKVRDRLAAAAAGAGAGVGAGAAVGQAQDPALEAAVVSELARDPVTVAAFKAEFNRVALSVSGNAINADVFTQLQVNVHLEGILGSMLHSEHADTDHDIAQRVLQLLAQVPDSETKALLCITLANMLEAQQRVGAAKELFSVLSEGEHDDDAAARMQARLAHLDMIILKQQMERGLKQQQEQFKLFAEEQAALQRTQHQQHQASLAELQNLVRLALLQRQPTAAKEPYDPMSAQMSARTSPHIFAKLEHDEPPPLDHHSAPVQHFSPGGAASAAAARRDYEHGDMQQADATFLMVDTPADSDTRTDRGLAALRNEVAAALPPGSQSNYAATASQDVVHAMLKSQHPPFNLG